MEPYAILCMTALCAVRTLGAFREMTNGTAAPTNGDALLHAHEMTNGAAATTEDALLHVSPPEKHSLFYIYSALNKDVSLPGIHQFTALGLLDDREIDYYNSKEQKKIPKQSWMMEKMQEDYWEKGTQSRKSKEQWFKVNVEILMKRMNHSIQDLHVLQWRHGCEIEESNGTVTFLNGIDQYSYDGSDFLSFDNSHKVWVAPVQAAEETKRKWDGVAILNQYTQGYLEKECVDWLTKFMEYGKETLRKHSPPALYMFAKRSRVAPGKLTLTCLATGFYPKDVVMTIRKSGTAIPGHLVTSSGVRPNEDATFQMRKIVDIPEKENVQYDCSVTHSSLKEPKIVQWGEAPDTTPVAVIVIVALLITAGVLCVIFVLKKRNIIGAGCLNGEDSDSSPYSPAPTAFREMTNGAAAPTNGDALLHAHEMTNGAVATTEDALLHGNGDTNGAANGVNGTC